MQYDPKLVEAITSLVQGMQVTASVIQKMMSDPALRDAIQATSPGRSTSPVDNPLQRAPKKWKQVGTQWPQIGGPDFSPVPRDIFMSSAYLKAYSPGLTRSCYVGRCCGLDHLSRAIHIPINKVSSCGDGRLMSRLRKIGHEQYGAVIISDGKEKTEKGFSQWSTYQPPGFLRASPNSPVIITGDALGVVMPATMTKDEFDEGYDRYIAHGSLAAWLDSKEGVEHFRKVGTDTSLGNRYTHRIRDRRIETELAKEIVAFRACEDYERLIAIIERVVVDHLELLG